MQNSYHSYYDTFEGFIYNLLKDKDTQNDTINKMKDSMKYSFLLEAVRRHDDDLVSFLIENGQKIDERILRLAYDKKYQKVIDLGTPENPVYHLRIACSKGIYSTVKHLLEQTNFRDINLLLLIAAYNGHSTLLPYLIREKGADPNSYNGHSLTWACFYGYRSVVETLLEYNVNVNLDRGEALRKACEKGHYRIIELLLDHKADIKLLDKHDIVMIKNDPAMVRLFNRKLSGSVLIE